MIRCGRCKTYLPESWFAPSQRENGRWCRDCMNAYRREHKDKRAEQQKAWRRRNPSKEHEYTLRRRYGLTVEQHAALLAKGCTVCGATDRRLVVDHDHDTGTVRGCLCNHCNVAIGHADESADRLRALADYLTG